MHAFKGGLDGQFPNPVIDVNGTLYGTTSQGGIGCVDFGGCGILFSISPAGAKRTVYSFNGGTSDGWGPQGGLTPLGGELYGVASLGGTGQHQCGIVFAVTPAGAERVVHSFSNDVDGCNPSGGLIAVNGVLYGTTPAGGSTGLGTIFSLTPTGTFRVLYTFKVANPYASFTDPGSSAPLTYANGAFYGTTYAEGTNSEGSVFEFIP